jgi:hypothetical protein
MSELETIGQRMGERLLASGLLSSVEVELQEQEKNLILVLSPQRPHALSPQYERIMRFCINFQGNHKSYAQKKNVFIWCSAFVEEISPDKTCRVWINCKSPCGYMGFDVLSELILLGLKLSQSLSPVSHAYQLEHLMQIYRNKEDVLTFCEHFIAYVIQAGDDLPTKECEAPLHTLWLCCPKHRFLFVQRLLLGGWLHHIFWNFDSGKEYLPDREYLLAPPAGEDLKQLLSDHLRQAFTPRQWLQARFAYSTLLEEQHWERPTKQCQRKHHMSWACCPLHTALNALSYLLSQWLEYFDTLYHISDMVDEEGHAVGLFSINWMALFIHLAQLDIRDISFPRWLEEVPSVNIQQFHYRQASSRHDIS